jgi:galactose mutarotase-like enzyme
MLEFYTIENEALSVKIKRKGAELCSVKDQKGIEFIWQAGNVWPKHAPNLFPIVGSLLDHEYFYYGSTYKLKHHGFARDVNFDVLHQSQHSICFVLQQSAATLKSYPFKFTLLITYTLIQNTLHQKFRVINNDESVMPVSFGGHPAFNANPIDNYYIEFSEEETSKSNQLSGPYINNQEIALIDKDKLTLSTSIFDDDALIFQNLKSEYVSLKSKTSNYEVKMNIAEFPYLGIWAKPNAPYVCLEPWQGLADYLGHNKNIKDKKGIVEIESESELAKKFSMEFSS